MSVEITDEIRIDKNRDHVKGLSEHKAGFQFECCVWCMTENGYDSGAILEVTEDAISDYYTIVWSDNSVNLDDVKSCIDQDEAAEYGAEAIALILGILRTDCRVIKKARKRGGGFDYWVGNDPHGLFQEFARLEISGIFEENSNNTINGRVKAKLEQLSKSDGIIPGFVIVVEFHKFIGKMVWKNGH